MKKELEKKDKLSLSYLPSAFITASLPLRDIKSNVFTRKYNNISMVITGSSKVPYGSYGRLVLSLLTTHAVVDRKSENGTVEIYFDREKDFLNELQAPASRAEKFREQLQAFSTSSFLYQAKTKGSVSRSCSTPLFKIFPVGCACAVGAAVLPKLKQLV